MNKIVVTAKSSIKELASNRQAQLHGAWRLPNGLGMINSIDVKAAPKGYGRVYVAGAHIDLPLNTAVWAHFDASWKADNLVKTAAATHGVKIFKH